MSDNIICLIIFMLCLTTFIGRRKGADSKSFLFFWFLLCGLELIYYFGHIEPLWFSHPRTVGFFKGIIFSFLFYIFIGFQIKIFFNYFEANFDDDYLYPGVMIVGGGAFLLGLPNFIPYVVSLGKIVIIVGGVIQLVCIYRIIFKLSYDIPSGLWKTSVYLVSLSAAAILFGSVPGRITYILDAMGITESFAL